MKFFGVEIGFKPKLTGAAPQPTIWRQAPVSTTTVDVGHGVVAQMSMPTGHHGFVDVVGESHYQDTLKSLADLFDTIGRTERTFTAVLIPEPENPYDGNAVAVMTEGRATIGYLSRDVAKSYHAHLARQPGPVTCPAKLTGGAPEQKIGVVLDFDQVRHLKGRGPEVSEPRKT